MTSLLQFFTSSLLLQFFLSCLLTVTAAFMVNWLSEEMARTNVGSKSKTFHVAMYWWLISHQFDISSLLFVELNTDDCWVVLQLIFFSLSFSHLQHDMRIEKPKEVRSKHVNNNNKASIYRLSSALIKLRDIYRNMRHSYLWFQIYKHLK